MGFSTHYQVCLETRREVLEKYRDFAIKIGQRSQHKGKDLAAAGVRLDWPEFYQSDTGFVSLNYDPIGLWIQFIANRQLNQSVAPFYIGSPPRPLHLFHDFGHLIPARGVERSEANWPWYPLNEGAAQRLNELKCPSGHSVRLTKFLFPHGCLCWRECPDCGKLSAFHGDEWKLDAGHLFPPPPLLGFDPSPCPDRIKGEERRAREEGRVDARACLHCETLTYTHHTQAIMQSSFKSQPASFIGEIHRDLRATAMRAEHIIFMGYSLPPDDVEYRAFFSTRRQREQKPDDKPVRCTIIDNDASHAGWYGPVSLKALDYLARPVIKAARDLFGEENIRVYGGGIPEAFLEGGRVTADRVEQLVDWDSTPTA